MRLSLARRGSAAALAMFIGLGTVVLGGSPAHAAVSISAASVSVPTVILDGDAGCGNRTKVTAKLYAPDVEMDDIFGVSANVVAADGDIEDFLLMNYVSRSGDYVTYSDSVFMCGYNSPGAYQVQIEATWWDESISDSRKAERTVKFSVKRPTSLTYNATPEPVKKNAKLTHAGVFKLDPVSYGPKKGVKGIALKFYFKANGTKTYVYKGQTTTAAGGKYSKKIKAAKSGVWKVVYAGSGSRQPQAKYDTVKVK